MTLLASPTAWDLPQPRPSGHNALSRLFGTGVATMSDRAWVFCLLLLIRSAPYDGEDDAFHGPPCPDGTTKWEPGPGEGEGQGQVGGRGDPLQAKTPESHCSKFQ